ncbi:MAG: hypothetical protein EKK51_27650 [Mycolicibacterium sp.]|jgi:hypothetical protein|nr:hypothetical protein [Mycolicibacterium llatzerense]RUP27225.1 MAG: hypothetical protein EKK51_27650 [Mycolicibacterium sp.]SHW71109.1 transposase, mutator type [Mycobacteroides abscessus subsp. abscessus]
MSYSSTYAISLEWAVLDRASADWRGLTMTPVGTRLLQDLRRSLLDPPRELRPPPASMSSNTGSAEPISATA